MYENKNFKEIIIYLTFTFVLTWVIWLLAFSGFNLKISGESLIMIGTFAPSFVGLLMEYKINGKKGFIKLTKKMVNPKISLKWYIYIFGVMPGIMLLSYIILQISGSIIPKSEFPIYVIPLVFIYIMFLMGPLGEEAGWRGFLLRKMVVIFRPFYASVILGLIWSLWHLPLFFIDNTIQAKLVSNYSFAFAFFGYILYTLIITIQISILYINTKGNIFGVILFHTMTNTSLGMMPLILSKAGAITLLSIMMLVTLALIIFNRKKLFENVIGDEIYNYY